MGLYEIDLHVYRKEVTHNVKVLLKKFRTTLTTEFDNLVDDAETLHNNILEKMQKPIESLEVFLMVKEYFHKKGYFKDTKILQNKV